MINVEYKNGKNAPSLKTLINRRGIQPIGDVFRIINCIETRPVKTIVSLDKAGPTDW